eukprot:SAG11_NODE_483_length_9069_cov_31.093534_4_plen_59_part_00
MVQNFVTLLSKSQNSLYCTIHTSLPTVGTKLSTKTGRYRYDSKVQYKLYSCILHVEKK